MTTVLANMEDTSLAGWHKACKKQKLDPAYYTLERWDMVHKLPWEILDMGVSRDHLINELNRALS